MTAATATSADRIAITGTSLFCVSGDLPAAAWSAVAAGVNVACPDATFSLPSARGDGVVHAMTAATAIEGRANSRFERLLAAGLSNLPVDDIPSDQIAVCLCTPPRKSARGRYLDWKGLRHQFLVGLPGVVPDNIELFECVDGVAAELARACDMLSQKTCTAVIFGATDSLVNTATYWELAEEQRLMTTGDSEGIIPGEAAAFVLIEREGVARARGAEILAYVSAIAHASEPHAGKGSGHAMTGLTSAIGDALAKSHLAAEDIKGVLLPTGQEPSGELEWYQTTQQLWPWRISEQERVSVMLGEAQEPEIPDDPLPAVMRIPLAFGEVGAATVPLQLVLGSEWFRFNSRFSSYGVEQCENLLLCETGAQPWRGAIVLRAPSAA